MSGGRIELGAPRPWHPRPACPAAPACPGCGCVYVLERRGVVCCACCGRPRTELPT
jgi:hypothetical protein